MSDLFDVELDSGSKCTHEHTLWLVAEGYGLCVDMSGDYCAWRFQEPRAEVAHNWNLGWYCGKDGRDIPAWIGFYPDETMDKDRALFFIQCDIFAHRALPFDEATERARLMPV